MRSASEVSERYLDLRRREREQRAVVEERARALRASVGARVGARVGLDPDGEVPGGADALPVGPDAETARAGLAASLEEMRLLGQREALAWALGVNEALTLVPPREEDRARIDRVRVTPVPAYDCYLVEFPRGAEGSIPVRPWGAFVSRPHIAELLAELLLALSPALGPWGGDVPPGAPPGKVVPARRRKSVRKTVRKRVRRDATDEPGRPEGA